jgi:hypothetical protein
VDVSDFAFTSDSSTLHTVAAAAQPSLPATVAQPKPMQRSASGNYGALDNTDFGESAQQPGNYGVIGLVASDFGQSSSSKATEGSSSVGEEPSPRYEDPDAGYQIDDQSAFKHLKDSKEKEKHEQVGLEFENALFFYPEFGRRDCMQKLVGQSHVYLLRPCGDVREHIDGQPNPNMFVLSFYNNAKKLINLKVYRFPGTGFGKSKVLEDNSVLSTTLEELVRNTFDGAKPTPQPFLE